MLPNSIDFEPGIISRIRNARIIAVTVIEDSATAIPLAETLWDAGIKAIEIALRTEASWDSVSLIRKEVPKMAICLGTVLTQEQVRRGKSIGVDFAVAPGLNTKVVEEAITCGLSFAPGVATPSEIEQAIELGCRVLKLFPAEQSGGMPWFKSITAPYEHLGIEYIPLGGLNARNFTQYLKCKNVPAVGGSWIAPSETIKARDWKRISQNAREAMSAANGI